MRNIVILAILALTTFASAEAGTIRGMTYNASLNRNAAGDLISDLSLPVAPGTTQANRIEQARRVAEVIQRVNPDFVLVNEFDYVGSNAAVNMFNENFLKVPQDRVGAGGASAINFGHSFVAPSNTGIASGFDLNNNGVVVTTPGSPGYGDDAFGFGNFPGQFGMAFYSKYDILEDQVRTFQNFLWKDMPGALLPDNAATSDPNDFYSPEELAVFRLSSKSHWDIPIVVDCEIIHILAAHPTPPVFDGPEDRNGRRNHDEIRFWADYIKGEGYIYDDLGNFGGLDPNARFVILGDYNADPNDGDSVAFAIDQFLKNPAINNGFVPSSPGGAQQSALQGRANATHKSDPAHDTADFADGAPGNLRADYVLPSNNFEIRGGGVFWPLDTDPLFPLVGTFNNPNLFAGFPTSDHRAVFLDLKAVPEPGSMVLLFTAGLAVLPGLRRRKLSA